MGLSRFIAFLALIGLSFVSALLFEARLVRGYYFELFVLLIGFLFSIVAVSSLIRNEASGWFLGTLIFGAALLNGLILFLIVKSFALLMLSIIINITGMIFSVLSAVEFDEDDFGVETYGDDAEDDEGSDEEEYIEVKPQKPKRKYTKRKTANKAASKKRTKRKKRK